jgi:hypothetical protein
MYREYYPIASALVLIIAFVGNSLIMGIREEFGIFFCNSLAIYKELPVPEK